jgi:hypothetical protein
MQQQGEPWRSLCCLALHSKYKSKSQHASEYAGIPAVGTTSQQARHSATAYTDKQPCIATSLAALNSWLQQEANA